MKSLFVLSSIYILFQCSTSIQNHQGYRQRQLEKIFDNHQKQSIRNNFGEKISINFNRKNNDDNTEKINFRRTKQVDPNDQVNVDLWNRLNAEDMNKMPIIDDYSNEDTAKQWLKWYFRIAQRNYQTIGLVIWNYETNITKETEEAQTRQSVMELPFNRKIVPIAKKFHKYLKNSTNENLKLIFSRLALKIINYDEHNLQETSNLLSQLQDIYSTTKVCEINNPKKCHLLDPYLTRFMQIETDYDSLLWAWKGWYDNCGNKIRPLYLSYIDLLNENIKENGFTDLSERWIEEYEMGNATEFESTIDQLLNDIMPLYEQLHAYVRGRLCSMYPNRFDCNGPIPAHILGDMWAQTWHDRFKDLIAFPKQPLVNITQILVSKNVTVHELFKIAESYFTSIDLYPMTSKFWARSLFEKPTDRVVVCHAGAMDMGYHDDYRIKMCAEINSDYFYVIHHEMGHIEYYMSYDKKQPFAFQDGANSGFQEAIGDTIALFAISPKHLIRLGYLNKQDVTRHFEINFLLRIALEKVAFLPFSYVMDKYRFLIFRNEIDRQNDLNSMWWKLRTKYNGIMSPIPRDDKINFDAGSKYHVVSNVPFLSYFIAQILQFQFHRAMCRFQGMTKRLYMCDAYGNKQIGDRLKDMLAMGNSKPWQEVLESFTGENKLDSTAILDFFEPLHDWLKAENIARGYPVGWM